MRRTSVLDVVCVATGRGKGVESERRVWWMGYREEEIRGGEKVDQHPPYRPRRARAAWQPPAHPPREKSSERVRRGRGWAVRMLPFLASLASCDSLQLLNSRSLGARLRPPASPDPPARTLFPSSAQRTHAQPELFLCSLTASPSRQRPSIPNACYRRLLCFLPCSCFPVSLYFPQLLTLSAFLCTRRTVSAPCTARLQRSSSFLIALGLPHPLA
ncbi:hypothetical protein OH77DRAFT_617936 [Trametes cingulata]|nr:hypothetical protein OH77DRAFT_617936 [Trametes cingulata]